MRWLNGGELFCHGATLCLKIFLKSYFSGLPSDGRKAGTPLKVHLSEYDTRIRGLEQKTNARQSRWREHFLTVDGS